LLLAAGNAELEATADQIPHGDLVEPAGDVVRELAPQRRGHDLRAAAGAAALLSAVFVLGGEDVVEGTLERAHHLAEADGLGRALQGVAAARPAPRIDDAGALQILKDLLKIAEGDAFAPGDVLRLRRAVRVVKGEVEDRPDAISCLGLELQFYFPIGKFDAGS